MSFFDAIGISASGLSAQRLRMNLISSNLANVNTTRTQGGGPYRRNDAVFAAVAHPSSFERTLNARLMNPSAEVKVVGISQDSRPPILKYDPTHPDADENGYVAMPNVNVMEEMVNLISATRSYEANVTAVRAAKQMAQKALEIGR
jgi:flagellar basal-body rod protein FlgC